jgi:glycine cleavage system aminomethyltransferase T
MQHSFVRAFRTLRGGGSSRTSKWPKIVEHPFEHSEGLVGQVPKGIPGAAPLSARLRKSPYFEKTLQAGVSEFTVYNRMLMPLAFEGGREMEYNALTQDAAIWDVAAERQVELKGPDSGKLAQLLTCRDVSNLQPGKCVYAIMTDGDGVVINDPVLLKLDDDHYWFSIADSDVLLWAKGVATAQGYDVEVTEPDVSPLAIQGPKSVAILTELYGKDMIEGLKYFGFENGPSTDLPSAHPDRPPIPTLLARSGWSPERGYEIYLKDGARGGELWDMVYKASQKLNIDLKPGAPNQQRRIEAGMLSFGGDTLENTNALELGLPKRFVDPFGTHDFIGKEALQSIANNGVERTMMGIYFLDNVLPSTEYWQGQHLPMFGSGGNDDSDDAASNDMDVDQIGIVTAYSDSPKFNCNLGIGYVDTKVAVPGTVIAIKTASGNMVAGRLSTLPFKMSSKIGGREDSRREHKQASA